MAHPMGELKQGYLRVDFDRRLKLELHGSRITSDAGLLADRELDDVLGLTALGGAALSDLRRGKNRRHRVTGLLRRSVFGRLAGYEGVNDAERLWRDPAMRAIAGRLPKACHRMAAEGMQFPWRWDSGTIATKLDVIWVMSGLTLCRDKP